MAEGKRIRVGMEIFVKAWQTSNTVAEVATKTGLKTPSVMARASKYRSLGIGLKNMKRGGGVKLDVDAAKALAASLIAPVAENTETISVD